MKKFPLHVLDYNRLREFPSLCIYEYECKPVSQINTDVILGCGLSCFYRRLLFDDGPDSGARAHFYADGGRVRCDVYHRYIDRAANQCTRRPQFGRLSDCRFSASRRNRAGFGSIPRRRLDTGRLYRRSDRCRMGLFAIGLPFPGNSANHRTSAHSGPASHKYPRPDFGGPIQHDSDDNAAANLYTARRIPGAADVSKPRANELDHSHSHGSDDPGFHFDRIGRSIIFTVRAAVNERQNDSKHSAGSIGFGSPSGIAGRLDAADSQFQRPRAAANRIGADRHGYAARRHDHR
jgi:hypothetical protein